MTFKKTDKETWKASGKNLTFYIDKETIDDENYIYILTICDNVGQKENTLSFYQLNEAKQYAKNY